MRDALLVFSGNANIPLAKKVANYLNLGLSRCDIKRFPDGEIDIKILENVRGSDAFVIQPTCPPVNENLMELLLFIDCLKRASAERITAVIPYYGYARQDRKMEARVPISARLVANLISASGADRVLTIDLHAAQIQGFFNIPVDHLFSSSVIVDYIKKMNIPNLTIVSPDIGGLKMVGAYAKRLNAEITIVDKRRKGPEEVESLNLIGDVKNKNCIIIDDILSTGDSIVKAVKLLRENGAKDIYVCIVHPVFTPGADQKIRNLNLKKIIVTDTIPLDGKDPGDCTVISVAGLLGEAIKRIHFGHSVSELFI